MRTTGRRAAVWPATRGSMTHHMYMYMMCTQHAHTCSCRGNGTGILRLWSTASPSVRCYPVPTHRPWRDSQRLGLLRIELADTPRQLAHVCSGVRQRRQEGGRLRRAAAVCAGPVCAGPVRAVSVLHLRRGGEPSRQHDTCRCEGHWQMHRASDIELWPRCVHQDCAAVLKTQTVSPPTTPPAPPPQSTHPHVRQVTDTCTEVLALPHRHPAAQSAWALT